VEEDDHIFSFIESEQLKAFTGKLFFYGQPTFQTDHRSVQLNFDPESVSDGTTSAVTINTPCVLQARKNKQRSQLCKHAILNTKYSPLTQYQNTYIDIINVGLQCQGYPTVSMSGTFVLSTWTICLSLSL